MAISASLKQGGLLIRETDNGNDWLLLTRVSAEGAGLTGAQAAPPLIDARRDP